MSKERKKFHNKLCQGAWLGRKNRKGQAKEEPRL